MKLTKKNIFVLLSVFVLTLVVAFSFQHSFNDSRDLATDSGFDSDFGDSGGSSYDSDYGGSSYDSDYGGSSYDSDYGSSYSSGRGVSIPDGFIEFDLFISFISSIFVIFPIKVSHSKKGGIVKYYYDFMTSLYYGLLIFLAMIWIVLFPLISFIFLLLYICTAKPNKKKMVNNRYSSLFIENIHDPSIVKEAYDIYVRIQEAWSNNNLEDVRDVLSPEMYNMYNSQVQTMIRKKQRNVMSDFKFVRGVIRDYRKTNGQDRYAIVLQVYCKDYMIDDETNKVIRGNSKKINDYIYSLIFLRDKCVDVDKCPNCNAELPSTGQNVKCEYCGSTIERKATNLVLTEKKMLKQR